MRSADEIKLHTLMSFTVGMRNGAQVRVGPYIRAVCALSNDELDDPGIVAHPFSSLDFEFKVPKLCVIPTSFAIDPRVGKTTYNSCSKSYPYVLVGRIGYANSTSIEEVHIVHGDDRAELELKAVLLSGQRLSAVVYALLEEPR